jgi:hypothetical protein
METDMFKMKDTGKVIDPEHSNIKLPRRDPRDHSKVLYPSDLRDFGLDYFFEEAPSYLREEW